jgi:hypothetical protein
MRSRRVFGSWALVLSLAAAGARAEELRTVTAGTQYAAGGWHRLWFGAGYRELWTTPIQAPVLDLKTTAGGLTPVRIVGQAQSLGLAMHGADGRAYTFRSLHKHPERMLPEAWRDRWPAKVAQDQTSGTHPAAAVILAPLAEAAGVAHTRPRLVVLPDDPALGEFREKLADEFGTFDEYPLPARDGGPGFMGATEIVSTTELWTRWLAGPENRIDGRAFLRARVLDLWVDNFDRHRGQWRWMRIPGHELWQPLPEDPDMVLVHHDGLVMQGLRGHIPRLLKFSDAYPRRLEGPLMNNFEVDRWLLSDLDASVWEETARDLQGRFTDEVIERALRQMPSEWFAIDGQRQIAALKARRADLVEYARRVYRFYARDVDVHATDRAETVRIARGDDDSVEVTIAVAEDGSAPWYRRRFLPDETDEVRLYLHGGDDRVVRSGPAGGPIRVRVLAGGGTDVVDDSRSGGTDVWIGTGTVEVSAGPGTNVREKAWSNPDPKPDAPWLEPRSFGHWTTSGGILAYHPDIELVLGYGLTRTSWGFRTRPAASVQSLRAAIATGEGTGKIEYGGTFRWPASRLGLRVETFASDIEQFNFFGYGNGSALDTAGLPYRAEQSVLFATPTARYELGKRLEAYLGPEVRYSQTPVDNGTLIGASGAYGTGDFGQLAIRGGLHFDSRERPDTSASLNIAEGLADTQDSGPVTGVNIRAAGFYVPKTWDVVSHYGGADAILAAYAGSARAHVAARVGGRKLWGEAPWFEAASIGGTNNRGFRSRRFIGDSSLFGSLSLRGWLGRVRFPIVPMRLGLVAFGDVGRVWLQGEDSDTWHTSLGGGLLLQPLGAPVTLHAVAADSNEGTRFYFGFGYPF